MSDIRRFVDPYRSYGGSKPLLHRRKTTVEMREGTLLSLEQIHHLEGYSVERSDFTTDSITFRHPCGRTLEVKDKDINFYFGNGKVYTFKLDARKEVGTQYEREIWEIQLNHGDFVVYGDFIVDAIMIDDLIGKDLFEI